MTSFGLAITLIQYGAALGLALDLHIRVIHSTTGQPVRKLPLDPTRNYQPQTQKNS